MSSSKRHSSGFLSVRNLLNLGNLSFLSDVILAYVISPTMLGLTQVIGEAASTGPVMTGFLTTSLSSIGFIWSRVLLSHPPPTLPTCITFHLSSYIAMTSEPKGGTLIPSPWV